MAPIYAFAHPYHPPTPPSCAPAGAGGAGGADSLYVLLSSALAAVRTACGPLLAAALAPGGALRSFDFLGAAVLDEVQGALAASLPGGLSSLVLLLSLSST